MQISSARSRTSAAGQYLGYALQPVRLCFHLLEADADCHVSLEHVDDVTVHHPDGTQTLEQVKSALKQNPVADWAEDLWKAFSNWLEMIERGEIDIDRARFRLYVTPRKAGKFVQLISDARSDEAVEAFLRELKRDLEALPRKPKCFSYVRKVLDADPVTRTKLLKKFQFESAHDDPVDAIRDRLRSVISDEMIDLCCIHAIGAAKEEIDHLLRDNRIPSIEAGPFQNAFKAFVRKNDLSGLLISVADRPDPNLVSQTLAQSPVFVKQLEILDAPLDTKLRAISDFLQTAAEKTAWAARGWVVKESFNECDCDLIRQHHFIQREVETLFGTHDAKTCGLTTYYRCMQAKAQVEGREVPGHFVPGCFSSLANDLRVGWHPEYRELIRPEEP